MKRVALFVAGLIVSTLALATPGVSIVVYDGYMNDYSPPQAVIAACSDTFCFGFGDASNTGTVTHINNAVGYGAGGALTDSKMELWVDGSKVDSVKRGLLNFSTRHLYAGTHLLHACTTDAYGEIGCSPDVSVVVVK